MSPPHGSRGPEVVEMAFVARGGEEMSAIVARGAKVAVGRVSAGLFILTWRVLSPPRQENPAAAVRRRACRAVAVRRRVGSAASGLGRGLGLGLGCDLGLGRDLGLVRTVRSCPVDVRRPACAVVSRLRLSARPQDQQRGCPCCLSRLERRGRPLPAPSRVGTLMGEMRPRPLARLHEEA